MPTLESLSAPAQEAWSSSVFAGLPAAAAASLLEHASDRLFASGEVLYRGWADHQALPVLLIVDGLVRVYVSSDSGRQVTVRYVADGDIIGLPALASQRGSLRLAASVISDAHVLSLQGHRLARMAAADVAVAWPIARYLAELHQHSEELWMANVFNAMRSRVAYHLLELSSRDGDGLVVRATQDELANAVGSVREVVARTLRAFADEGLIERSTRSIRLCDPAGLHTAALAQDARDH